jgi:hypothetical protein
MNLQDTPKENEYRNDLDIYIDMIVERLKKKYDLADKNRLSNGVRFIFNKYTFGEWMMRGAKESECFKKSRLDIPYTELQQAMKSNTLPTEIQKLL